MKKPSYDKQITRWAQSGVSRILMYGRWWDLKPGVYRVQFNRAKPSESKIVECV